MKSPVGSACDVWQEFKSQFMATGMKRKFAYLGALRVGIEDPEIRAWIDTSARTPLPPSIIGGKITIYELLHEMLPCKSAPRRT